MQGRAKIGVFLCQCGGKISNRLDLMAVTHLVEQIPGVAHVETLPYPCLSPGLSTIQKTVEQHGLNRLVVGGCSPRLMKKKFSSSLAASGIREYQLELVNVREHVAQVHEGDPEELARKAAALVSGSIAGLNTLVPVDPVKIPFNGPALILGGGISGFAAARELSRNGIDSVLATDARNPDEVIDRLITTYPGNLAQQGEILAIAKEVFRDPKVRIIGDRSVASITGHSGDYHVAFRNGADGAEEVEGAAIILALDREYGPGEVPVLTREADVIDQVELETRMMRDEIKTAEHLFLIAASGGDGKDAQLAFSAAWQDSLQLVTGRRVPGCTLLYPADLKLPITGADLALARRLDIRIRSYQPEVEPLVQAGYLTYIDPQDHLEHDLPWETLVCSSVPKPLDDLRRDILQWLPVWAEDGNRLKKAAIRVRPAYAPRDALFIAGSASGLCTVNEAFRQGKRAAREITKLRRQADNGGLFSAPTVVKVSGELCEGCGLCAEICPCGGVENITVIGGVPRQVDPLACAGCGTCAAACPHDAIQVLNHSTQQMQAQVRAILAGMKENEVLAFVCNWGGMGAADLVGEKGITYTNRLYLVPVDCLGSVDPTTLSMALLEGAGGVLMIGCPPGVCHYGHGVDHSSTRINFVRKLLHLAGVQRQRVALAHVDVNQAAEFVKIVESFFDSLDHLGPPSRDHEAIRKLSAVHSTLYRPRVRWVLGVGLRRPSEREYPADRQNALEFDQTTWDVLKEEYLASRILSCVAGKAMDPRRIAAELEMKPQQISAVLLEMMKDGRLAIQGWQDHYPLYAAGL